MSLASHIATLNVEHAKLERMLPSAIHHHEDDVRLATSKKRKLRIKDEIALLYRQTFEAA